MRSYCRLGSCLLFFAFLFASSAAVSAASSVRVGYPQPSGALSENPTTAAANPRDFFDNRFLKEIEESGFVQELYGRR